MQLLIERQSIDAVDSSKVLRRLFSLLATAPSSLNIQILAPYIISKNLCDILQVAMICLYLEIPGSPGYMSKYTYKSPKPEIIDISTYCLVKEVINSGLPIRLNNLNESLYNQKIDGISGMKILRLFSVPLRDRVTNRVFGAINLINKHENDFFTNADELFLSIFALQTETLLSSCYMFSRITSKANLLSTLLRASSNFASSIPSTHSLVAERPLLPGKYCTCIMNLLWNVILCELIN